MPPGARPRTEARGQLSQNRRPAPRRGQLDRFAPQPKELARVQHLRIGQVVRAGGGVGCLQRGEDHVDQVVDVDGGQEGVAIARQPEPAFGARLAAEHRQAAGVARAPYPRGSERDHLQLLVGRADRNLFGQRQRASALAKGLSRELPALVPVHAIAVAQRHVRAADVDQPRHLGVPAGVDDVLGPGHVRPAEGPGRGARGHDPRRVHHTIGPAGRFRDRARIAELAAMHFGAAGFPRRRRGVVADHHPHGVAALEEPAGDRASDEPARAEDQNQHFRPGIARARRFSACLGRLKERPHHTLVAAAVAPFRAWRVSRASVGGAIDRDDARTVRGHAPEAERAGFEPAVPSPAHTISSRAPSTTRSPLPVAGGEPPKTSHCLLLRLKELAYFNGTDEELVGAESRRTPAEDVGFEPTVPLPVHLISNQAPSTTRPTLRRRP